MWKIRGGKERRDPLRVLLEKVGREPMLFQQERRPIEFIIAQVRDDDLDRVPALLAKAADVVASSNGVLEGIMSSIVWATFGAYGSSEPVATPRDAALRLIGAIGGDVRVLYGRADCLWGMLGSGAAFRHGMVLRDTGRYMSALLGAQFGSMAEMD